MSKPILPNPSLKKGSRASQKFVGPSSRVKKNRRNTYKSDVLISAVISPYLLTHLHHLLQRAEYGASKEGQISQAANFAQLRKVLCMDARSMEDASALGSTDGNLDKLNESNIQQKVA
tara:strand:- start:23177 stop:23530 length:354 start_codon:yes stop_codon:yes gene_type:complete